MGKRLMDKNDGFYVMAFNSTSHSIQAEKKAKELFRAIVIPTPGEITAGCGFAIKFLENDGDAIKEFMAALTVPAELYFLGNKKNNGKREIEKIT